MLVKGIKRTQGKSYKKPKRKPITPNVLNTIHHNLFTSDRCEQDKLMIWAALLTAFFGFLRVSEYTSSHKTKFDEDTTLLVEDVYIHTLHANITIKASKTDPFRQGVCVRISRNNTTLCPINALLQFLRVHPTSKGPLFTFNNGKYLSKRDVNKILRETTHNAIGVSSHSLRIGAASTAAAMGCPKWLIQRMGRWSSECFKEYIRIPTRMIDKTSRALSRCRVNIDKPYQPMSPP